MASPGPESQALQQAPRPLLTVSGRSFANLEDIISWISTLPAKEQYEKQLETLILLNHIHENAEDAIARLFMFTHSSGAWKHAVTENHYKSQWNDAKSIADRVAKREKEIIRIKGVVAQKWGAPAADEVFAVVTTEMVAREIRRAANLGLRYSEVKGSINRAMLNRLTTAGAGKRRVLTIVPSDIASAIANPRQQAVTKEEAVSHGYTLNWCGWISRHEETIVGEKAVTPRTPAALPVRGSPHSPRSPIDVEMTSPVLSPTFPSHGRRISTSAIITHTVSATLEELFRVDQAASPQPKSPTPAVSIPSRRLGIESGQSASSPPTASPTAGPSNQSRSPEPTTNQPPRRSLRTAAIAAQQTVANLSQTIEGDADLQDLDESPVTQEELALAKKGQCSCKQVSASFMRDIVGRPPKDAAAQLQLLKKFAAVKEAGGSFCFAHTKLAASKLGLRTQGHNLEQLTSKLRYLSDNRDRLGTVKASDTHFSWFRNSDRPPRPEDALGIYRFEHLTIAPVINDAVANNWSRLTFLTAPGANPNVLREQWENDGSIVVPGLMGWWATARPGGSLLHLIKTEMDMYLYHQRLTNRHSHFGWLRSMYHGVGQQLMRQDPAYYLWYILTRPDSQWRLISYPYYAKYSRPGEPTKFRHIDINPAMALASGRGMNTIQGSLSLDEEVAGNCTEIIPTIHRRLGEWWDRVKARNAAKDGFVLRVLDEQWTRDDANHFGVDWTNQPCPRLAIRLSHPALPHGSTNCTAVRRTMLPWFVGIQEDHETLDMAEGGSWSQLSAAHRDLLPGPSSPSGLGNLYSKIPYAFPAALPLTGLGAISDALVGRVRWDSPVVRAELNILFGPDVQKANEFLIKWKINAEKRALALLKQTFEEEKAYYGDHSFFTSATGIPPLEPLPAEAANDRHDHY
jgi:hypothetical protein